MNTLTRVESSLLQSAMPSKIRMLLVALLTGSGGVPSPNIRSWGSRPHMTMLGDTTVEMVWCWRQEHAMDHPSVDLEASIYIADQGVDLFLHGLLELDYSTPDALLQYVLHCIMIGRGVRRAYPYYLPQQA